MTPDRRRTPGGPLAAIGAMAAAARNLVRLCGAARASGFGRALWLLRYVEEGLGGRESSARGLPVDALGLPLPWYTFPAIEYLEQLDVSACDVFEYGSGNGSRYWARRARTVTSVESDPRWHRSVAGELAANQRLLLREDGTGYVGALHLAAADYDIIIIDGAYRYDCAIEAVKRLRDGGLIVLDNSDWYPGTARLLRESGFIQVDFAGTGPVNAYAWCTSLYFRGRLTIPRGDGGAGVRVHGGLERHAEHDRPAAGPPGGAAT